MTTRPTDPRSAALPAIEFEGIIVKPTNGVYRCPFECGDKRYPAPKWKTEYGFRRHMETCWMRPSEVAKREERTRKHNQQMTQEKLDALMKCPIRKGDVIHYVREVTVKPTHEQRGSRIVKMRYEPVMQYTADIATVREIDYNGFQFVFNGHIALSDVCASRQEAERRAVDKQRSYDEHVTLSRSLR